MSVPRSMRVPDRRHLPGAGGVLLAIAMVAATLARAADVPTPEGVLGFRPGADGHLASWAKVVEYVNAVDKASDRVVVRELGRSTEGRPLIAAIVSSSVTGNELDRSRALQARLHDPRQFANAAERARAIEESKPVVVITCSIHSTETASTLMALELLHELATGDDAATREVLDNAILVLIPSVNPDGVDKVAAWYERSRGTPWEGSGMVELYHKYAGHDTNRDWFMLNLVETRLISGMLYRDLFPTLLYDVHQMGSKGARLFVPPFYDPINPNLDPRVNQGIFLIGAHMAADLAAAGKRGVLTNAMYDNWWNGGNRTTPQRHNIVAVLTEAASVKMATPIFLEKADLKGGSRGFADHRPAVNFVDPWPGGWWRLRDIVEYEKICARSLLTLAARYRRQFQSNLAAMAADSIEAGKSTPPYGWIIPRDQVERGTAARMLRILNDTGIEVHEAKRPFDAGGASYPEKTWYISAAQPYRAHVKDMMERQVYPDRFTAGGKAEAPYDVAGWTLPLQMGVKVVQVDEPFQVEGAKLEGLMAAASRIAQPQGTEFYRFPNRSNDDLRLLDELLAADLPVQTEWKQVGPAGPWQAAGPSYWVKATPEARAAIGRAMRTLSVSVEGVAAPAPPAAGTHSAIRRVRLGRLALYQPWVPSMDEGWTRLVLDDLAVRYTTVHDAEVRAGGLKDRFDVVLIPSISPKTLREGYGPNETEPQYVGGLGAAGIEALRAFVREGGRVVCLDASSDFAIDAFQLPVKNVLKGLPSSTYYAPGSILEAVTSDSPLTVGVPPRVSVYVDNSAAFELTGQGTVALRFAAGQPLQSGWLLGPDKVQGKAALVTVPVGSGSVVLFGFRPQHRGQPHGTFRLLHNALLRMSD